MDSKTIEEAAVRLDRIVDNNGDIDDLWFMHWFFVDCDELDDYAGWNREDLELLTKISEIAADWARCDPTPHALVKSIHNPDHEELRWQLCGSYDWRQAFLEAMNDVQAVMADIESIDLFGFDIPDVAEVIGIDPGENNGPDWLVTGRLYDGRWFALKAGCCYTGWDCKASGWVRLARSRDTLLLQGVGMGDLDRLGIELELPIPKPPIVEGSISPKQYELYVGEEPKPDDLVRANCDGSGHGAHDECGWCYDHMLPRFMCRCRRG